MFTVISIMLYCFLLVLTFLHNSTSFFLTELKSHSFAKILFVCFLRDTFVLCLVNGGSSFVAGFAIFSVLGFMSYEQGLPISEVAASGKTARCLQSSQTGLRV